jgi:hypothetical protein
MCNSCDLSYRPGRTRLRTHSVFPFPLPFSHSPCTGGGRAFGSRSSLWWRPALPLVSPGGGCGFWPRSSPGGGVWARSGVGRLRGGAVEAEWEVAAMAAGSGKRGPHGGSRAGGGPVARGGMGARGWWRPAPFHRGRWRPTPGPRGPCDGCCAGGEPGALGGVEARGGSCRLRGCAVDAAPTLGRAP